jgi:hypothetical protein
MSDKSYYYLRATIDFVTWDEKFAKVLIRECKEPFGDEAFGRRLSQLIQDGRAEIDAIQSVENHGDSDLPGLVE